LVIKGNEGVVGSTGYDLDVDKQLISSVLYPSLQSSSPSHFQDANIHFLLAHFKTIIKINIKS